MENGWIKFYREWLDNPIIMKDAEHLATWIYLLSKARHTKTEVIFNGEKIVLNAGQLIISCREIYEDLKIERNKLNRIFTSLKSEKLIEQQTSNHKSLITLPLWDFYQGFNEQPNEQQMSNQRVTKQETENEKEKRSKREKDKEKEINKNERMKEIYIPSISPQGETGREDFPLKEKDLDKWLEEDDGIDDWDKFQIFYKNLNSGQPLEQPSVTTIVTPPLISKGGNVSGQQDCYTEYGETNSFDNTNPIQQENKVYNKLPPKPPSFAEGEITQNACISPMQSIAYHQPEGAYHQPLGCIDNTPVSNANPSCDTVAITQNACISPMQSIAYHHPEGAYHQPLGCIPVNEVNPYPLSPVSNANPSTLFDEFWQAYPKKVGKGYAFECFKKTKPTRKLVDIMLEAIKKQKKSDMWKRDKGQYIPNPSTWLNQKRWEDDLGGDTDENPWSSFKLGIEL